MIGEGQALVEAALARGRVGPFQLQAAIAALHGEAASAAQTDWSQIVARYRLLAQIDPGPVVALNLAVALAEVEGPRKALDDVDRLAGVLAGYQPFHAARAEVLRRLDDRAGAVAAYDRALELTRIDSERAFLSARRAAAASGTRR